MEFISTRDFDSDAERVVWEALKDAFEASEPGYCWHRYPITSMSGPRLEPDLVIDTSSAVGTQCHRSQGLFSGQYRSH
jgi:hypothetical protein